MTPAGSTARRAVAGCAALALLLVANGALAQMYKWTDAKGVVHFSDTPPPASARRVERKTAPAAGTEPALPYGLARAARNSPVTLYTSADCGACDQGRALLRQRGIPFREKTVASAEDQLALSEAGGAGAVPLLLVGRGKIAGFEPTGWGNALSEAGYPAQSVLPRGYRQPAAEPAAPPKPAAAPAERPLARDVAPAARPRPPAETAPSGFRF